MRKALFVWGGWDGHTPRKCVDLFAPWLAEQGFDVEIADTLDVFADDEKLKCLNLVVPVWTMGELTPEQEETLCQAVARGVGLAGWHAGLADAFRSNTEFQFMAGGQFVSHPGGILPAWNVKITNREHEITKDVADFTMRDTERYYLHIDPSNEVLATTPIADGFDMPVIWTRNWGRGRVAYNSIGHTCKDFEVPEAKLLVQRSLLWAAN